MQNKQKIKKNANKFKEKIKSKKKHNKKTLLYRK